MRVQRLLLCVCLILVVTASSQAQGWRSIVPLHSTRADVERLIGKPNFKYDLYDFENERVDILYSQDPCSEGLQGMWNVPRDTVISITVAPKIKLLLSELQINLQRFKKTEESPLPGYLLYTNEEEGITYVVLKEDSQIMKIHYGATTNDKPQLCPKVGT